EFKKFAITQNKKVSGKDKEIAQLLKNNTNILAIITKQKEVIKEVLIEQKYSYQDYGTQELINKMPNLASKEQSNSKRLETKAKEITEYKYMLASYNKNSNSTITNNYIVGYININAMKITTQNMDCSKVFSKLTKTDKVNFLRWRALGMKKADVFKIKFKNKKRDDNLKEAWTIHFEEEKILRVLEDIFEEEILVEWNKYKAHATALVYFASQKDMDKAKEKRYFTSIPGFSEKKWNKLKHKKLRKKEELIDSRDKEDLKMIQELYETDLNIQLDTIDENINKEDLTRLCKEWAKIVYKEWKYKIRIKVVINRVIAEEAEKDEFSKLVHEEEKVLDTIKFYFEKQFCKRNSLENKMPSN
ncbi:933_t:CDS:2, partial [Gigaspora margarita]